MRKFRIVMGALALAVVAATVIACTKDKETQQETPAQQNVANPNDLTLAEMIEAISWEEGKAFFENQPIKDYTYVCEKVLNDCGFWEKSSSSPTFVFGWHWATPDEDCRSDYKGLCFGFKEESQIANTNAVGYFEDGKFIIVPTTDENGFTADGYLVIGMPVEVQNDSIIILNGIYTAYFDDKTGNYVAVAVDYTTNN